MADCCIYVEQNYKTAYQNYLEIDDTQQCFVKEDRIIYGDMRFEKKGKWCLITANDEFALEVLLQMSSGNKLIYFYTDEDQLDGEFIVLENNTILRKFLRYGDTPELNEDHGKLSIEEKIVLKYWNDLDLLLKVAGQSPDLFFENKFVNAKSK